MNAEANDGFWYGPEGAPSPSGVSGEPSSPPRRRRTRSPRSGEVEVEVEVEAEAEAERLARRLSFEAQRRWLHDTMGCISGPASPSETSPQARRRLASSSVMRQIEIGHPGAVDAASRELLDPVPATRAPADLAP